MGDSRKIIREFPEQVRASVGYALQLVQAGETPIDAKPFKGIGSGVYEIVKRYAGFLKILTIRSVLSSQKNFVVHP